MSEFTKSKTRNPKPEISIAWILFALVVVAVYFFALDIPLLGPDEPRYSQVAREMFQRNDWVTPTLGGFDWFEKPALLYWLQIASYKLFGVSEFSARFGSALFGLGTIFALWILGKRVANFGDKIQNSKTEDQKPMSDFANWLALIAASSLGLLVFSRAASFDIILTFPITASLVSFYIFEIYDRFSPSPRRFVALSLFYFFIGVALIAKGLIGIVFPLAIVAFYYLLSWRFPSKAFIFSIFWGTILSLIVASAWYLPMYQANGWKFIDEFFIQHHFQRYTSNKYLHPQPFWFFWVVLPAMTIPWLPFFIASVWRFVKNIFNYSNKKELTNRNSQLAIFAVAWLLVPLVFFSISGSKLPGYILPALPAALILTAIFVYEFVQKSPLRRFAIQISAFLMFVFVIFSLNFLVDDFASHETEKFLVQKADETGFADTKILTLHNISHNLEFYGANRLERLPDGKQKYFYGTGEVKQFIEQNGGKTVLVLVPLEHLKDLSETDLVKTTKIGDNGEKALFAVELKK